VGVFNFTPVPRYGYRVGAPLPGVWNEALNSDAVGYGGSDVTNGPVLQTEPQRVHGLEQSFELTLPPLGALILRHGGEE
jgi:1,4-alpha-glucan branching enzyme